MILYRKIARTWEKDPHLECFVHGCDRKVMEFAALVLFGRGTFHACVSKTPATSPSISVWIHVVINISGSRTCWQDREGGEIHVLISTVP